MKILAIGNSFSVNAMAYLERIMAAGKCDAVLGNLYIGGCSLERHYNNMVDNIPDYSYHIHSGGSKVVIPKHTLHHALVSDDWDIITMQQVSTFSGKIETFEPYMEKLIKYVRTYQPKARIMLHKTWAYEHGHERLGVYYEDSQEEMFRQITKAYNFYSQKYGFSIIPSGDAYQIARQMPIFDFKNGGKSLCADDRLHASATHGQYLLGSVWYETLTGDSILENPYSVDGISFYELMSLKKAAHEAVLNNKNK